MTIPQDIAAISETQNHAVFAKGFHVDPPDKNIHYFKIYAAICPCSQPMKKVF